MKSRKLLFCLAILAFTTAPNCVSEEANQHYKCREFALLNACKAYCGGEPASFLLHALNSGAQCQCEVGTVPFSIWYRKTLVRDYEWGRCV